MDTFRDRVVLITGAGSGIGRQLALTLAGEGARIAAVDLQAALLDKLAGDLAGKAELASVVADVTDLPAVRAGVAELAEKLGPIDMLIASAGIGRETAASNFQAEDLNAQINVNLIGVINSIDAVLPGMRERRRGHLVALSSLASYRGLPRMAGYCASKAGVNALLDSLRVELRPEGIAVTTVCPGWIRTPLTAPIQFPPGVMMEVDEAARRILEAIRSRRPFFAFPSRSCWQVRLLRYLPCRISDWLTGRVMRRLERAMQINPPAAAGAPQQEAGSTR
jgi:NAD(P)-dependent dehydrogenase (short-subunit alcohol dehydrogenase family)